MSISCKKWTKEHEDASPTASPHPHFKSGGCGFAQLLVGRVPGRDSAAAAFALIKGSPVQGELSSDNETEGL